MSIRDEAIEAAARAMCLAPDRCVHGSGWATSTGSGSRCDRYAWQDKIPEATAAFDAIMERLSRPDEAILEVGATAFLYAYGAEGQSITTEQGLAVAFPAMINSMITPTKAERERE